MKIFSKILNVLVVVLVISGICFPIYYFGYVKAIKVDYELTKGKNRELTYTQEVNNKSIIGLKTDLHLKDVIIQEREASINSLYNDIDKIHKDYENKIEELKDITLEEAIDIIINYYGYTNEDVEIVTYENEIRVLFKPSLVHEWTYTLVELESRNNELSAYFNQVIEYDSLICDYIDKVNLLEEKDSLQFANYELEVEKNSNLEEIVANRNDLIKSIKVQRNILGVITGIVIVLALL